MIDLETLAGCKKCRAIFDIGEMAWIKNPEFPERSNEPYIYDEQCPRCGERDEITDDIDGCYACGQPYIRGEKDCLGLCPECEKKAASNPGLLLKFFEHERYSVEVSPLVGTCFTQEEINGILYAEMVRRLYYGNDVEQDEIKTHLSGCVHDNSMEIADFINEEERKNG